MQTLFTAAEIVVIYIDCSLGLAHSLAKFGYQDTAPSSICMATAPDFVIGLLASNIAEQQQV
jgi:hypothetical protein